MDYYDFYKELYHKENDRKQEVINSVSIPLAVITALAASNFFLVTSFPRSIISTYSTSFGVLVFFSGLLLLGSIFYLGWSLIDFSRAYEYEGLAYPGSIYDWHKELKKYYEEHYAHEIELEKLTDDQFRKELTGLYIKYTDHNQFVNDQKYARIFRSKACLVFCLASTVLSLIPFLHEFFNKKDDVHKVEIINNNSKQRHTYESARNTPQTITRAQAVTTTTTARPFNQRRTTAPTAPTSKTP